MKLSKRSTIIAVTSLVALMGAGGVSAYYVASNNASNETSASVQTASPRPDNKSAAVVQADPKATDDTVVAPQASEPALDTPLETTQAEAIVVLSSQEYGLKYLNLSTPEAQQCFDWLQRDFPARFEPGVRKHNIQALQVFASTCSTGYFYPQNSPTDPKKPTVLNAYGKDGAFFDSELAKSRWQD